MRGGQLKTNKFSQLFDRISAVRVSLDLRWDDLAKKMDVHRSLFFQVKRAAEGKRGGCGFSERNLAKLKALESEAGIKAAEESPSKMHDAGTPPAKSYESAPDALLLELSAIRAALDNLALRFSSVESALYKKYKIEGK